MMWQVKVQEALARASHVYLLHTLKQYGRPQHDKGSLEEMHWEFKVSRGRQSRTGVSCPHQQALVCTHIDDRQKTGDLQTPA